MPLSPKTLTPLIVFKVGVFVLFLSKATLLYPALINVLFCSPVFSRRQSRDLIFFFFLAHVADTVSDSSLVNMRLI
jgi:hypothetical protein